MGPIDQTMRLLSLPSLQRIVKERRHGALFLPALLQMYAIANDLASVGLIPADEMKTLKQTIATAWSSDEPLQGNEDQRSITEMQSLMQKLLLLSNSTDAKRATEWLCYWLSTGVPEASTTSVDAVALLMSVCKDASSTTLCCKLLAKLASINPSLSNYIFPLVLQHYAKASDPAVKSALLAIVPKLATHRLCIPPILKFLLAMCQQPNTRVEALGLLGELWERHERLFTHFQEWLTKDSAGDRRDWALAKVQLMRKICRQAGDDYGEDLLPILSGIINRPPNPDNEELASEAVMAISDLCRLEVIELPATWKQLWSKLRKDERTSVQIALCHLLSIASIETEEAPDENFVLGAISQLWQIANTANDSIKSSAFEALAKFNCRLFTLKMLPEVAKAHIKLPASKTADGSEQSPDEVLTYIPGFCFVDLLDSLAEPARLGYKTLLKALIRTEVTDFGRAIYHVKPVVSLQKNSSPLRDVESSLMKQYEEAKQDDVKAIVAVACLYIDLTEGSGRSTESAKRQAFVVGRKYLEVFSKLLSDIRVDANDWRKCVTILSGWHCFVRNMYEALISARYAELEMDANKRSAESAKRLATAWLWARDQIVEKMKRAAAECTVAQLNTFLALASLIAVVQQHKKTVVEEEAENECAPYVAHKQWLISALETLLSNAWPAYKMKARPLLTQGSLSNPSAMMSSFASVSACCVMPLIMEEVRLFLGPVDESFLTYLRHRTAGDLSTAEALCLPLALGLIDSDADRFTDSAATTSTIGRTLGAIAHFARRCDAPPASLLDKLENETMLSAGDKGPIDIAIYYHLSNYAGASSVVAQERLEAMKREKSSRQDELKKALEVLKAASSSPEVSQAANIRAAFRLLNTVEGAARTDGEKQLAAFVTRLMGSEDKDTVLISAAVDGLSDAAAVESFSSAEKRLPQSYSSLAESSVLCAVVDKLLQPELPEDVAELLIECILGKFRDDGRSLPPLDWQQVVGRWTQDPRHQPLLIRLAGQEQSAALAGSLISQERLNLMTPDILEVLAAQLASFVALMPPTHLNRAFKQCFEAASSSGHSAMLGHLWTAIETALSLTVDKASATSDKATRQMAFDWVDTWIGALPAIDSEAVSALPIFACFGDLGSRMDDWDLKKRLKRLEYDSLSKCMWLHCHLLKTGHWQLCSARSLVELLIAITVEQRCTALLMLMESARVAGVKLFEWSKRCDWLLDMMNDSLVLVRGSANDEALESSGEGLNRAALYFSVLTAMAAGWAPTAVPHGLLRGDGDQRPTSIDEKMWNIVQRRFPSLFASLLNDSEFDAIAHKITEWAIDIYIAIKPIKCDQTPNIEACLRTLLSHNPDTVSLFDRKGMWDDLLFANSTTA
uniref:DUF3730 domain-containing protein n=1 Tax=Plectus sambesii TaxID=2011161 RepID=A0A914VYQ7_9BILA